MSRWRHNMPAVVCRAGFWFVCHAFSPARCHFQHWSVVPGATLRRKLKHVYVKIVRLNALRTWPWSFFVDHEILFYFAQRVNISKLIFMYLQKNCRQANGNNRHIVPDVPTGLDRDIRDMPIACARTHPDANKHARHIPVYRPAHSAHANKCSQIQVGFAWKPHDNTVSAHTH